MNADVKKRWLEVLRSGEYAQAGGALRSDVGYCCLGVLCDLYVKDGHAEWHFNQDMDNDVSYDIFDEGAHLPGRVMDWAGLNSSDPYVETGFDEWGNASLAELNDSDISFAQIADLIEEQL